DLRHQRQGQVDYCRRGLQPSAIVGLARTKAAHCEREKGDARAVESVPGRKASGSCVWPTANCSGATIATCIANVCAVWLRNSSFMRRQLVTWASSRIHQATLRYCNSRVPTASRNCSNELIYVASAWR